MPSLTAIVTNSIGKPPASRTPTFARFANRSSGMLHGVTSFLLDATPTCALSQSASVIPTARNIARAGARSNPSVTSWLRGFMPSLMRSGCHTPLLHLHPVDAAAEQHGVVTRAQLALPPHLIDYREKAG